MKNYLLPKHYSRQGGRRHARFVFINNHKVFITRSIRFSFAANLPEVVFYVGYFDPAARPPTVFLMLKNS